MADRVLCRDWRDAARYGVCVVPSLAWYAVLMAKLPPARPVHELGFPLWAILQRLLIFRPYPDPVGQLVLRLTDFLAVAGLIASLILAALWLRKLRGGPVEICVALYGCFALVLGTPVMADPFAFGRVISPLLLWILIEAIARKDWSALAPPLLISLNVAMVFVRPLAALLKIIPPNGTL